MYLFRFYSIYYIIMLQKYKEEGQALQKFDASVLKKNYEYDKEKEYILYCVGTGLGRHAMSSLTISHEERGIFKVDNYVIITEEFMDEYYPKFVGGFVDMKHEAFDQLVKTGVLNENLVIGEIIDYFFNSEGFEDSQGNIYKGKSHIGQPIFVVKIQKNKLEYEEAQNYGSSSMGYLITESEEQSEGLGGVVVKAIDKKGLSITLTTRGLNFLSNNSVVRHDFNKPINLNDNNMENKEDKTVDQQLPENSDNVEQQEVSSVEMKLDKILSILEGMNVSQSDEESDVTQSEDDKEDDKVAQGEDEDKKEYNAVMQSFDKNLTSLKNEVKQLSKENVKLVSMIKTLQKDNYTKAVSHSNDITGKIENVDFDAQKSEYIPSF